MTVIDFPEGFFTPPTQRPQTWPDNLTLRSAVDWLKGFLPAGEWRQRRDAAAHKLYRSALGELVDRRSTGAFFDDGDSFGWFLFLADAFLDHIQNYEPMYGSRVVPVLTAIGRDLDLLRSVEGVEERVARMVGPERAQPNGGLFELLVAAAYRREDYHVAFVPEQPPAKTHDMDVTRNGRTLAVECKRMETGDYGEAERMRMRELWGPSAHWIARQERSAIATIRFRVPIEGVPRDYVTERVVEWWRSGQPNRFWHDDIAYGSVGELDLRPLRVVLESDIVLAAGTRMQQLLSGVYERNANFVQLLRMKYADNPRYIDECDLGSVDIVGSHASRAVIQGCLLEGGGGARRCDGSGVGGRWGAVAS